MFVADPLHHLALIETKPGALDHLYVTIERTSSFAIFHLVAKANRVTASAYLVALIKAAPYKFHMVLTDYGIQVTFPPRYADGPTATRMTHMFGTRAQPPLATPSPQVGAWV